MAGLRGRPLGEAFSLNGVDRNIFEVVGSRCYRSAPGSSRDLNARFGGRGCDAPPQFAKGELPDR
jgi:hypothetical protein